MLAKVALGTRDFSELERLNNNCSKREAGDEHARRDLGGDLKCHELKDWLDAQFRPLNQFLFFRSLLIFSPDVGTNSFDCRVASVIRACLSCSSATWQ